MSREEIPEPVTAKDSQKTETQPRSTHFTPNEFQISNFRLRLEFRFNQQSEIRDLQST
jgi:hypothetical protein